MSVMCDACAGDATSNHVKCGFCSASFHPECTGVSDGTRQEMLENQQLFWLCRPCTSMMLDIRFRNSTRAAFEAGQDQALNAHSDTLQNLKSEILHELKNEIRTNFATLINSNTLTPKTSQRVRLDNRYTRARRLFSVTNAAPTQKPVLLQGTGSTLSPSTEIQTVPAPQPKFWLYLSRVARDVSVEQINALACHRLGTTDVQVIRLVAKGKDISTLSFVSFKIGIDAGLKTKALSTSTWPKGLVFREFSNNSTGGNFWRPRPPPETNDPMSSRMEAENATLE